MGMGRRAVGGEAADERKHLDHDATVVVKEARQGAEDYRVAPEFLPQFAHQGSFGCLARFDLAAGKLPLEAEMFMRGALGEQHAPGRILEDGADNRNRCGAGRRRDHAACLARNRCGAATFRAQRGSLGMNTFLKVLLIVIATVIAVKLLPIVFGLLCGVAALLAGLGIVGVSLVALLVCAVLVVAAILSPIWLPILAIAGAVTLYRRNNNNSAPRVA